MKFLVIEHVAKSLPIKGVVLTMRVGRNTDVSLFVAEEIKTYSLYGATKVSSFTTDEAVEVDVDTLKSKRVSTIVSVYDTVEEAISLMLEWQKAEGFLDGNIIRTQAIGSWIGKGGSVIKKINKYSKNSIRVEKI